MSKRITRRELLRDVGAVGTTTLLAVGSAMALPAADSLSQAAGAESPAPQVPQSHGDAKSVSAASQVSLGAHENPLVELAAEDMIVAFNRKYGSISSIARKGDTLGTNFIRNEQNTPGGDVSNSRWTGDLVTHVWDVTDTGEKAEGWL